MEGSDVDVVLRRACHNDCQLGAPVEAYEPLRFAAVLEHGVDGGICSGIPGRVSGHRAQRRMAFVHRGLSQLQQFGVGAVQPEFPQRLHRGAQRRRQ